MLDPGIYIAEYIELYKTVGHLKQMYHIRHYLDSLTDVTYEGTLFYLYEII